MMFNPYSLLRPAATGDLNAQRAFAEYALKQASIDSDLTTVRDGLIFARLAAAHGTLDDHGRLIILMGIASTLAPSQAERDIIDAEALAHMTLLAEAGVDLADQYLPRLAAIASPEALIGAAVAHQLMKTGAEAC